MSEFGIWELLLFQFVLIMINAIFACAEIAVISINENKLKKMAEQGNKSAERLVTLMIQPAHFLATIQVGITFAGFLGSAFAADNFSDRIVSYLRELGVTISYDKLDVMAVVVITLILSYVTLILGELVPKRVAMQYAEKIALTLSLPIYWIAKIFLPLVWLLTQSTNVVLKILGVNPNEKDEHVSEEEIRLMIDVGSEKGTIDGDEQMMLHNVFEFDDKLVSYVMTPLEKVIFVDVHAPKNEWEEVMIKHRFSVYPVCQNGDYHNIGILSVKDYFKYKNARKEVIIGKAVKPVERVSEKMKIKMLFKKMQKEHKHFALVENHNKSVIGIVTMTDLLEELVGELEDDVIL